MPFVIFLRTVFMKVVHGNGRQTLKRWLGGQECALLFQLTQVCVPALMTSNLQPPVTDPTHSDLQGHRPCKYSPQMLWTCT